MFSTIFIPLPQRFIDFNNIGCKQGGRGLQWAVYYTSPQSFIKTFSHSLAQDLLGLWLDLDETRHSVRKNAPCDVFLRSFLCTLLLSPLPFMTSHDSFFGHFFESLFWLVGSWSWVSKMFQPLKYSNVKKGKFSVSSFDHQLIDHCLIP